MLADQTLDTWNISNRMLFRLLDAIPPAALSGVSASGGRSVGQMFAHIHNVRLMWLEVSAPDLMASVEKIPVRKKDGYEIESLRASLDASRQAMETLFRRGLETGKIKDFRPHPMACFGYFIAHEWYHIGEIGITLTQAGYPLDDKAAYAIWEWGKP